MTLRLCFPSPPPAQVHRHAQADDVLEYALVTELVREHVYMGMSSLRCTRMSQSRLITRP
jgi:hypothetical protein